MANLSPLGRIITLSLGLAKFFPLSTLGGRKLLLVFLGFRLLIENAKVHDSYLPPKRSGKLLSNLFGRLMFYSK